MLDFSQIPGMNATDVGMNVTGEGLQKFVATLGEHLRAGGQDDDSVDDITDQLSKMSHLTLHNGGLDVPLEDRMQGMAHENLHARMNSVRDGGGLSQVREEFAQADPENYKQMLDLARADWGAGAADMSEDDLFEEALAEALVHNKTEYGDRDSAYKLPASLEQSLDKQLTQGHGSNVDAFTSNLTDVRPTVNQTAGAVAGAASATNFDSAAELVSEIGNLTNAIEGLSGISSGMDGVSKAIKETGEKSKSSMDSLAGRFKSSMGGLGKIGGAGYKAAINIKPLVLGNRTIAKAVKAQTTATNAMASAVKNKKKRTT